MSLGLHGAAADLWTPAAGEWQTAYEVCGVRVPLLWAARCAA